MHGETDWSRNHHNDCYDDLWLVIKVIRMFLQQTLLADRGEKETEKITN